MLGVLRGWWSNFTERNNICHWDYGIRWRREGKNVTVNSIELQYQFGLQAKRLALGVEIGGDEDHMYTFRIAIPLLFAFWLHVDTPPNRFTKWFVGKDWLLGGRETGFSIDRDLVSFRLHSTTLGWSADKWCGWTWIRSWREIFMGDHNSRKGELRFDVVRGSLGASKGAPEGHKDILFDVKYEDNISSYSRWYLFWYHPKWTRISLTPREKIVVPGKGDNGWDQDDETMGEISFGNTVKTLDEAIIQYNQALHRYMGR